MKRRKQCYGTDEQHVHRGGCRFHRPLCRWGRRALHGPLCGCEAYHYPHRKSAGLCVHGPEGSDRLYNEMMKARACP